MPSPIRIPLDEMHEMLGRGKSLKEIADHFGVSYTAVYYARQKLKTSVVRGAAVHAHRIVSQHSDVVSRMQKSLDEYDRDLERLLDLLEEAATVGEKTNVLKVNSEIMDRQGKQISRIIDAMRAMADFQVMAAFIGEVLTTIERVNKDEKIRIIRSLENSCGSSISAFLRTSDKVSGPVSTDGAEVVRGGCADGSGPGFGSGGVPEGSSGDI